MSLAGTGARAGKPICTLPLVLEGRALQMGENQTLLNGPYTVSAVSSHPEDFVAGFSSETLPIAGRIVRMGRGSLSPILQRHAYPGHLGEILGEALILSALVGSGMKFQGRVMTQAEGDGPVSMLVGEYRKDGGVRAYGRFEQERWAYLEKVNRGEKPHMPQLFGPQGALGLIIVHDQPDRQPYQGLVPLDRGSLPECAEDYFRRSEQVDTCLAISVGRDAAGEWHGGHHGTRNCARRRARAAARARPRGRRAPWAGGASPRCCCSGRRHTWGRSQNGWLAARGRRAPG